MIIASLIYIVLEKFGFLGQATKLLATCLDQEEKSLHRDK